MRRRPHFIALLFFALALLSPGRDTVAPEAGPPAPAPSATVKPASDPSQPAAVSEAVPAASAAAPDPAQIPPPTVPADTEPNPPGAPDAARPPPTLLARINGLFDIDLPQLYPPGTFNLDFNPHFSDLVRRDYIRISTGVRWALNENLGLEAESLAYVTHHLRHGNAGYGFGQINLGTKYLMREWPDPAFETSIAFDTQTPVGHPPVDLTDGRNHYTPSFVTEYHPQKYPKWTPFAGANYDFVTLSRVPGTLGLNTPGGDSVSFLGGVVYDLGQIKWTFQSTFTTTAFTGGRAENIFSLQPSLLWFLPRRFTFNSKTQWIVGLGIRSTWGPDGYQFSTNSRVRAEITFRQFLDRLRQAMDFRR